MLGRGRRVQRLAASRLRGFEGLETRRLLYSAGGQTWPTSDLSYSYLPDGSDWRGQTSSLFATLDGRVSREVWQREVARALQSWANHTNLNFYLSPDDGSRSGLQGVIRLAGVFNERALGSATLPAPGVSGGDITLNLTYAQHYFEEIELYTLVLHEAGHALGLKHSEVADSVMQAFLQDGAGLSADDIAGIQSLYGVRDHDAFDQGALNNDFATSSLLDLGSLHENPATWRADLTTHGDVDYYRFVVPPETSKLTVEVDARELSLLAPQLTVYDSRRNVVATSSGTRGSVASIEFAVEPGQTYTIAADGATADEFGMGAYRLRLQREANAAVAPPPILPPVPAGPTRPDSGDQITNPGGASSDTEYPAAASPLVRVVTVTRRTSLGAGSGSAAPSGGENPVPTVPPAESPPASTGSPTPTPSAIGSENAAGNAESASHTIVTQVGNQIVVRVTRKAPAAPPSNPTAPGSTGAPPLSPNQPSSPAPTPGNLPASETPAPSPTAISSSSLQSLAGRWRIASFDLPGVQNPAPTVETPSTPSTPSTPPVPFGTIAHSIRALLASRAHDTNTGGSSSPAIAALVDAVMTELGDAASLSRLRRRSAT